MIHIIIPTTVAATIPTLEEVFFLPVCALVSLACPLLAVVDGVDGATLEDVAKSSTVDSEVDTIVLVITKDTDTVNDDINIVLDMVGIPKYKSKNKNY